MTSKRLHFSVWVAAAVVIASVGCGGKKAPAIATEMVEGLVTLDGTPVPEATITFVPVQPGVGAAAAGTSDSDGKYRLTAVGAGSGAQAEAGTLPGEYYVGVTKVIVPDIQSEQQRQEAKGTPDVASTEPGSGERPQNPKFTYVVPERYSEPQKSGLKVTVKAGQNDIPIPLSSK